MTTGRFLFQWKPGHLPKVYPRFGEGAGGGVRGHDWELTPSPCGCHCANSKVGPLGSAAGDRESVTATTPRGGLQEPSREPVPNNEVHLKSPEGRGGERKRNRSKSESPGEKEEVRENSGSPSRQDNWSLRECREGRRLRFQLFRCFSSAPRRPCTPTLQPWGPGSCADRRSKLGKKSNMTQRV